MSGLFLLATMLLGADPDPKLAAHVEKYAEGIRQHLLPEGQLVKAPLQLPNAPLSFLIWSPAKRLDKPQWFKPDPKSDNPAGDFAKWATGFMMAKRRVIVTHYAEEDDAKEFVEFWLSRISRNATALRVVRVEGTVIWGDGDLMEKW